MVCYKILCYYSFNKKIPHYYLSFYSKEKQWKLGLKTGSLINWKHYIYNKNTTHTQKQNFINHLPCQNFSVCNQNHDKLLEFILKCMTLLSYPSNENFRYQNYMFSNSWAYSAQLMCSFLFSLVILLHIFCFSLFVVNV